MEKEFETYEYLVKYNGNEENNLNAGHQIIIVQENEHNLINENKSTEFIAQDENRKEFENVACPMFAVSQQPVYFQLNNSSELIPIAVNSLPTVEPSNDYENTYLLPNMTVEVIQPANNVADKHNELPFPSNIKDKSECVDVDPNRLPGGYAEITLNDEQYEILKQKGWILLEIKDKVFLLDSSGLHEITNEHGLIAKLKHESNQIVDSRNSLPSRCSMKVVMIPENTNCNVNMMPKLEVSGQAEPMDVIDGIETGHQEEITDQATQNTTYMAIPSRSVEDKKNDSCSEDNNEANKTENKPREISFKTPYLMKDIPNEIVLGKTVNGKNLIARVIHGKGCLKNTTKHNKHNKSVVGRDRNISDKQFAKLVQQVLLGTAENCRIEDIATVETVIAQMYRVPDLRPDLQKLRLIITKTIREENVDGLIQNQSEPVVITGRVIINGSEGGFIHIPDMLPQIMKNSELRKHDQNCDNDKNETTLDDDMFLHVNITDTKDVNNVSRVSVMVNRRYLSLSQAYNMKTKHINAVYACKFCAKVFKLQEELEDHQEYHCLSESPKSTASKDQHYTVVKTSNKLKVYMCNECNVKFVKLKECREHLKTHHKVTDQEASIEEKQTELSDKKNTEVFKCQMCDITYFHSSSLTKHVLAKHIKAK